jgi:hypothetical protein
MTADDRRALASALASVIADEIAAQRGVERSDEELAPLLADRILDGFDIRDGAGKSAGPFLSPSEAYEAAYRFVWQYSEREVNPGPESLELMVVHMEPTGDVLRTSDPAAWEDWSDCVWSTVSGNPIPRFPSAP